MRDLINFLYRYTSWILFLVYVIISCALLFSSAPYQRHVWMTSAGAVSSVVYDAAHNVTSYFYLKEVNENLEERNGVLESEVAALKHRIRELSEKLYADTVEMGEMFRPFDFIVASVTNNSVALPNNYLTLNKGKLDGVKPEMGVIDANGIVGVVNVVADHHAQVISMLNPDFRLSCKVKGNDIFGSLVWDGEEIDEAILEELPRHAVYNIGDTIVTSGFSTVFPEGVPIGRVTARLDEGDDNFFRLKVKLFTDFTRLSTVRIVVAYDSIPAPPKTKK